MLVKANLGERCPKEGKPREYITDADEGEEVPDTAYYRRLVMDGSLLPLPDAAPEPVVRASKRERGGKSE